MSKLLSFTALLVFTVLACSIEASNKYPIVLVHGFSGWGRSELLGLPYWGKVQGDYQEKLKKDGHQVFTVGIGKVSSNWDRACELYAQIKGGKVDYGLNHSTTHGHARFGRTYPGLFPEWGTVVNGSLQKIHLMGHSLGGTTIRMLSQLLNHGAGDALTIESADTNPLFAGGKDWVHSITTIGSPNQGTTLADMMIGQVDLIENMLTLTAGAAGMLGEALTDFYDPQLDQWGLKPKERDETPEAYWRRIMASGLLTPGHKDNCGFSMTVSGAAEENSWVKTLPNIYYYSFVADATVPSKDSEGRVIAKPNPLIDNIIEMPIAEIIGSRSTSELGLSDDWLPNDGLVNVISQISDGVSDVIDFDGASLRGAWVSYETLRIDHSSLMGMNKAIPMYDVYKSHAALIADLPSHEDLATASSEDEHPTPEAIVDAMRAALKVVADSVK